MIAWNNVQMEKSAKTFQGPEFGLNRPKLGPQLNFLSFSQVWFISFPRNFIDDSLEHCLTTSRGKTHEKSFGAPSCVQNQGFYHFLNVASIVFLNIAQDCSVGQCLTSSRAETSPNWGRNHLFYSNVVECPLKLACLL